MIKHVMQAVTKGKRLLRFFIIPVTVIIGIILYLILSAAAFHTTAITIILAATLLGSIDLFREAITALRSKEFALDYIAITAIVVALITHEYLVAGILSLMIATGTTLEDYAVSRAKRSLTRLINRIPQVVTLWEDNAPSIQKHISTIAVNQTIWVRKGEVIPLDGVLISEKGETDESSLTGEPYFIEKLPGDTIRSGTINIGTPMVIRVTKVEKDSTYKKIITMVQDAEQEKSPLIRLADQYTSVFTLITFTIASFAYIFSGFDITRVLAVLAVATPCPLIIATPIALIGGMNTSAKQKIIIKKLAALEAMARATTIVFDKTGTITFGHPTVTDFVLRATQVPKKELLGIAATIERNSLHPLAKAVVEYARKQGAHPVPVTNIHEELGKGIMGTVQGRVYRLAKLDTEQGMTIGVFSGTKLLAIFTFTDEMKADSKQIIKKLKTLGLELFIFTGDKKEVAEDVVRTLGETVTVRADMSPKDKQDGIAELKKQGKVTAMIGDGINDAPALALADVGIAFSNQEEQTAASEAADIVLLGGNLTMVYTTLIIAKRTSAIARQSIVWGIGLSILAMSFAAFGKIPPLFGAGLQEAIDVAVILNALRASF